MSTSTATAIPGSPRAGVDTENARGISPQKPPRPASPTPRSPQLHATWHRATPLPPGSPREVSTPCRSTAISLGSRDKPVADAMPADDLKRHPQMKRLAQDLPEQRASKRARTASPPSSPRTSSPRPAPARDVPQASERAAPSIPALTLAKAQLQRDCLQAKQLGENLREVATLAYDMQFRVRDVEDSVRIATEHLDHMNCCLGDPDKHQKVEEYREAVKANIAHLLKIFSNAPSSIQRHQYYEHTVSLTSEMGKLIVDMQPDQPLAKASLVESPRRDERDAPRAGDGNAGVMRKPLRVVMDPQKSTAEEKDRADS